MLYGKLLAPRQLASAPFQSQLLESPRDRVFFVHSECPRCRIR
jgi:hypothetical protein